MKLQGYEKNKLAIGKNVHRHFAERKVLTGASKTYSDNESYEMEVGRCYKYLRHSTIQTDK